MSEWFTKIAADFTQTFIEGDRWQSLLESLGTTLLITLLALVVGAVLGVIVAAVRSSHDQLKAQHKSNIVLDVFNGICEIYLTIIRGTPVMVQLLIMYFVIMASSTNTILVATISFGINSGAYLAEVMRSGIMAIDKGQSEAGRSLGLSYLQTMRFIVLPQAVKNILPALGNELIALLKETSIMNVIGMKDITKWALNVQGVTYQAFMPLIGIALIYLVIVLILTRLVSMMERRLANESGKRHRNK